MEAINRSALKNDGYPSSLSNEPVSTGGGEEKAHFACSSGSSYISLGIEQPSEEMKIAKRRVSISAAATHAKVGTLTILSIFALYYIFGRQLSM